MLFIIERKLILRVRLTEQIKDYIIILKYNYYIKSNTFHIEERSY